MRKAGKSYNAISAELGCSKGTVSYHVGKDVKPKQYRRMQERRVSNITKVKQAHGGKCSVCGYARCLAALDFHHIDPSVKKHEVSYSRYSVERMATEAAKCVLLCSNCHRELHAGFIALPK